jgi:hypothetical protein
MMHRSLCAVQSKVTVWHCCVAAKYSHAKQQVVALCGGCGPESNLQALKVIYPSTLASRQLQPAKLFQKHHRHSMPTCSAVLLLAGAVSQSPKVTVLLNPRLVGSDKSAMLLSAVQGWLGVHAES